MDMLVAQMIINRSKKEQEKTKEIISMVSKKKIYTNKGSCPNCGQYLPWFCVCYLNKCSKE
jgi:hypothetical protein